MRLKQPRIEPVRDEEFTDEHRRVLEPFLKAGGKLFNIIRTGLRAPEARAAIGVWGAYVLSEKNSLPARQREIVILRAGWLCRSGYEFTQHRAIALGAGLSNEEIERVKAGAEAGWAPADAALIRACDDIVKDHFVSDASWAALERHFSERQRMDVVFTATQYVQVSTYLNSFGVQLEPGVTLDPDLDFTARA